MKDILFIYDNVNEKNPEKKLLEFLNDKKITSYDIKFLCSVPKTRVLKKDIDLDFSIFSDYKVICPIGASCLKYVTGVSGIQKYNGVHIEKKYLPIMNPDSMVFKPQNRKNIDEAFDKIVFILGNKIEKTHDKDYRYITTDEDFKNFLEEMKLVDRIVVDIETTGLSPIKNTIISIGFSTRSHQGICVGIEVIEDFLDEVLEIFESKICIFHNAKFDMKFLMHELGAEFPRFEDTMLLHYCLEEKVGTHGLKELALRFTDLGDYDRELTDYKKSWCRRNKILLGDFDFSMIPMEILAPYNAKDCDATFQLFEKFKPLVDKKFKGLYENILIPATKSLIVLENNGGPIDKNNLLKLEKDYDIEIEECLNEINTNKDVLAFEWKNQKTFNPNSYPQLREIFFDIAKLKPIKKTEKGANSVDKEVLEQIEHPLAAIVLDLRSATKLKGTYVSGIVTNLDKDNRLRSSFNIQGTTSGRLSSSQPINYQNIPREEKSIKRLWKAREGYKIIQSDLATAEVYVAACLSNDEFLQSAFTSGLDFHSYIAKNIFKLKCPVEEVKDNNPKLRQAAKAITFGIMYQAGPRKISEEANISVDDAQDFITLYFRQAKQLYDFIRIKSSFINREGYIHSHFGRKRRLPEVKSSNRGVSQHAIRSGVNFLIQSVASDITLLGFNDLVQWITEQKLHKVIIPFTVVHDSVVAEVREDYIDIYKNKLTSFLQKDRGVSIPNCPIGVDHEIGDNWGDVK